ncbi:MAG TPA: ATP-binding protein [Azonexus sp.]|nr:ATP-binding protein [Azonexus sp.]
MEKVLDILVSGVHDAKNQLFFAESVIASAEAEHSIALGEARYAIEAAANRLSVALSAYRLLRHGAALAITPTIVGDLCTEVALAQRSHLAGNGIALDIDCRVVDEWALDRDLVADMLNNAIQNAGRFARGGVRLSAAQAGEWLVLSVEDDGPGFSALPPRRGTGLLVAGRLAGLHARKTRHGSLHLSNGGALGGACFTLRLP